jgi:uncharacterized membrane protein YqjE
MNHELHNGRTVAEVLTDLKEEVKEFVSTRVALFRTEVRDKLNMVKVAAPLAIAALLFLATAYLLLTGAVIALVASFISDNSFRWVIAFAVVGVIWGLIGGACVYMVKRELEIKGLMPKKTMEVLKGDKLWIQSEVRGQI